MSCFRRSLARLPPLASTPWFATVLIACLLLESPLLAADPPSEPLRPAVGPRAGGSLAHVGASELGLLGDTWADVPLGSIAGGSIFTSWFTRSAITDTTSDFAFTVRDLEWRMDWGWRRHLGGGKSLACMVGGRGRSEVDSDGGSGVAYLALGIESQHFGRTAERGSRLERVSWQAAAGPVIGDGYGVSADAIVRAAARARLLGERLALSLDVDGLIDGGHADLDVTIGPSVGFPVGGGRLMSLFVRYLDAGNPLGVRSDTWLAGFEYTEGPVDYVPASAASRADIGGTLALGAGGDSRESARMFLRLLAPELASDVRIAFTLDANVLSAVETNELYYLYDLGLERVLRYRGHSGEPRAIAGAYFYHRSNHQLEHAGNVTSLNVAEVGLETPRWHGRSVRQGGRLGALDARLRVGYLIDSDFGLDHRWHARGGLRWQIPLAALGGRLVPFLSAEAESGDVNRRSVAAGVFIDAFQIQLQRRTDDQYFAADREATLLTAGYRF